MNISKHKATTVLTEEDFPPLSRHSTQTLNPKFLSITPPHENILFSQTVRQTLDSGWSNIISVTKTLLQTTTTGYMKSKPKTENLTVVQQQRNNAILPRKRKHQSRNHKFYPTSYPTTFIITYTISTTI